MTVQPDTRRRAIRRLVGLVVAAAAVGGSTAAVAPAANAAPNQYAPSAGKAIGVPAADKVTVPGNIKTTAPCPDSDTVVNVFVDGASAGLSQGILVGGRDTGLNNLATSGIPADYTPILMAQNAGKVLVNGHYDVSVICYPDNFGSPADVQFDGGFTISGGTGSGAGTNIVWDSIGPAATTTTLAATPTSTAVEGADVALTARVSPTAAGTVQFIDNASGSPVNLGSPVTVAGGTATLHTTALAAGPHSLTAKFTPADVTAFAVSTSAALAYTVTAKPAAQATTTTISATPQGTAVAGSPVQLSATVSPSTAAGTVQFVDVVSGSNVNLGSAATVTNGTATASTTSLSVGPHSLKAVFAPTNSAAFTASTSAALAYSITQPQQQPTVTTTSLAVSPGTSSEAGKPVTLTATVAPGTASGTVQFVDTATGSGAIVGSPVPVNGGTATMTTPALSVGQHPLKAVFTPSDAAAFATSMSSTVSYTITQPQQQPTATTTALAASPSTSAGAGKPVTLTASVTPNTAAGTVQFVDAVSGSNVSVGTPVSVNSGTAALTTSSLSVGQHSLKAVFAPTDAAAFTASTSAAVSYTITQPQQQPTTTTTALAVTPDTAAALGSDVTLTATLSPAAATGSVQFIDVASGSVNVGTPVSVAGGKAVLHTTVLTVGHHSLKAAFTPIDAAAFTASTSAAVSYTITQPQQQPAATTTALTATPANSAQVGNTVTFTATVAAASGAPVGAVQISDEVGGTSTPLGSPVPLANSSAKLTTSALAAGSHQITATYLPTDPAAYTGSASQPLSYTITPVGVPTAKKTSIDLFAFPVPWSPRRGQSAGSGVGVMLFAVVHPQVTGTIQFYDTVNGVTKPLGAPVRAAAGVAIALNGPLPSGRNVITAVFTPKDPSKYQGSTSKQVVLQVRDPHRRKR